MRCLEKQWHLKSSSNAAVRRIDQLELSHTEGKEESQGHAVHRYTI